MSQAISQPAKPVRQAKQPPAKQQYFVRFTLAQRLEHLILLTSFTVLGLTGLPQMFAGTVWGLTLINLMGGIEFIRIVHRIAAVVLMLEVIYHGAVVTYKVYVERVRMTMMPGWNDVVDAYHSLVHNLGIRKEPPKMGRYTFGEKAEYWAVIWGTVIMVVTGFMLWNPIATTRFLPGEFIPAAKVAHGGEGLLAVTTKPAAPGGSVTRRQVTDLARARVSSHFYIISSRILCVFTCERLEMAVVAGSLVHTAASFPISW
jgi:cytochrome b subunit of formate dehydrogenase